MHHYVSSSKFILGSGAELRGSFSRKPLPEPYSLVVDTADLKEDLIRHVPACYSAWTACHPLLCARCCDHVAACMPGFLCTLIEAKPRGACQGESLIYLRAHFGLRRCIAPDSWLVCILRYTNIQLINTIGVKEADKRECLECWCKVRRCTSATRSQTRASPRSSYRAMSADD